MKKALLVSFGVLLMAGFTACSGLPGKKDDTAWVEAGAAMISEDIRSGQIVIDGQVYTFPMQVSDFLDNGFHISNSYENVEEFELEPGNNSTSFELFSEDGEHYVRVSAYNVSQENLTVDKCLVDYLYVSASDADLVLPAGIYKHSKPAELQETYTAADEWDDSESGFIKASYHFNTTDNWNCAATIGIFDNDYTIDPLANVEYSLLNDENNYSTFLNIEGGEESTRRYIDAAMKAVYYGDFDTYTQYYSDDDTAKELHESAVSYFASAIMQYAYMNYDDLGYNVTKNYDSIAAEVLKKVQWNIKEIAMNEDDMTGTVTLELIPTNYFDVITSAIDEAVNEVLAKYEGTDIESLTESQIITLNQSLADVVLAKIAGLESQAENKAPVEKTYQVDCQNGYLSGDDWTEIHAVMMGLNEQQAE